MSVDDWQHCSGGEGAIIETSEKSNLWGECPKTFTTDCRSKLFHCTLIINLLCPQINSDCKQLTEKNINKNIKIRLITFSLALTFELQYDLMFINKVAV